MLPENKMIEWREHKTNQPLLLTAWTFVLAFALAVGLSVIGFGLLMDVLKRNQADSVASIVVKNAGDLGEAKFRVKDLEERVRHLEDALADNPCGPQCVRPCLIHIGENPASREIDYGPLKWITRQPERNESPPCLPPTPSCR